MDALFKSCQFDNFYRPGGPNRDTPRTSTVKVAIASRNGDNQHTLKISIPEREVPSNLEPMDMEQLRETMKELFETILMFFTKEEELIEAGKLKEEDALIPVEMP